MATAPVTPLQATRAGATATYTAAASGDGNAFVNSGTSIVLITVAGAATDVVATFDCPITVDGNAVANPTVACGANTVKAIKPFPKEQYNQATGATDAGKVVVTWTGTLTNAGILVIEP